MKQYFTVLLLTSNQQVGGSSPPGIAILLLENPSLSINHSFCRLLSISMILSAEMAICHSKSDLGVTRNTLVSSDFCLDGAIGLS